MGTMHNRVARAAATVGALVLAATAATAPATAESVTYSFDSNPYVRSVRITNNDSAVVVKIVARRTPKSVVFRGWSVYLDTVADHRSDVDAGEFYAWGPWKRAGIRLVRFSDDGSYEQTRVACDGLRTSRDGRAKTITIPRACLIYGDVEASAVRVQSGVNGDQVKPSGTSCWGVGAPRRGWTAWLEPGSATQRASAGARTSGTAARGC
jgi:hypothetical protein